MATIGSMMIDRETIPTVLSEVGPEDFYAPKHIEIVTVLKQLYEDDIAVDLVTVLDALGDRREDVGGAQYLATLAESVPSSASAGDYAAIVKEKSDDREIIRVADDMCKKAYGGDTKAAEIVGNAIDRLQDNIEPKVGRVANMEVVTQEALDSIEASDEPESKSDMCLPILEIDNILGGLVRGRLGALAARPGVGKTVGALQIATYTAMAGNRAAIFSLEMSRFELWGRIMAYIMQRPVINARGKCVVDSRDADKFVQATKDVAQLPLYLIDAIGMTIMDIEAEVRKLKKDGGLDLVVIDYFQLMKASRDAQNRAAELTDVSISAKVMARRCDVYLLMLAQLNRASEDASVIHRPKMAQIKDCGSLEQDADQVMLLHRPHQYDHDPRKKATTEWIIEKNRHGPSQQIINLRFDENSLSFKPDF